MNNSEINNKKDLSNISHLLDIIYIALFTAIIAVSAQISIPTAIPFTLQTLGVFITGAMLGWKRGTISVLVYILLAIIGIPVLAGFSGGIDKVIGITGGYIIGFVFTAFIVGIITQLFGKKIWVLALSMVLGLIICYLFGTIWFSIVSNTGFVESLMICVVPYLIFDALKIVLATILVNRLDKIIKL